MFVRPVPKISQVMMKWRRRASHLCRFTLWHNGILDPSTYGFGNARVSSGKLCAGNLAIWAKI